MRVIGGKYRHRLLSWPEDVKHIRPTKDRIREAIFSALGDIDNYQCLDLYSGSGAMGIEALSRGASHSTFVDINQIAIKTTLDNLKSLNINNSEYEVIGVDDISALKRFHELKQSFDLVFLDPPYKEGKYQEIIDMLFQLNLLNEAAIIVVEADHPFKVEESRFNKIKDYKYGDIFVSILWR